MLKGLRLSPTCHVCPVTLLLIILMARKSHRATSPQGYVTSGASNPSHLGLEEALSSTGGSRREHRLELAQVGRRHLWNVPRFEHLFETEWPSLRGPSRNFQKLKDCGGGGAGARSREKETNKQLGQTQIATFNYIIYF